MGDKDAPKHTNRLAKEKSPYLLQHGHNPVDWYPWGDEAFKKAKEEDKPIFLSIGYSTCHWCHVMERESFEDEEIAKYLNEHFVAIKVDREERPDIDQIYMAFVQDLTGHGGWPLSAFLTPELKPFHGGTYFPPKRRGNMPGFLELLQEMVNVWTNKRDHVNQVATARTERVKLYTENVIEGDVAEEALDKAYGDLKSSFDSTYGGFGRAPKFPQSTVLSFLLRHHRRNSGGEALKMVETTLEMMYRGGMYDHLGGGFHRYSTDARWLVPHFEKMLYDNSLLARTYIEAYQVTGKEIYAQVARETLDYILSDMTHPEGGFYSAEDADSEGEEGLFYVWTQAELMEILGDKKAKLIGQYYGVTEGGNFEHGKSILHLPVHPDAFLEKAGVDKKEWEGILSESKKALLEVRSKRIRPGRDDKIITAWNGLMISAMAQGYQVLGDERYREAARRASDFILKNLVEDGRLLRRHREESDIPGYIDDYAFLQMGLLDLYEATFDARYFQEAVRLANEMVRLFWDEEGKGFFFTGEDGEKLIARPKEIADGAIPSGNAVAVLNLLRLGEWTSDAQWRERAETTIRTFGAQIDRVPRAFAQTLCAIDFLRDTPKEIVLAGDPESAGMAALLKTIHGRFIPNKVIALVPAGDDGASLVKLMPMLKDRTPLEGKPTAYVCENYACKLPTNDPVTLAEQLKE